MDAEPTPLSTESLLQHQSFLRSVVRGMLTDDGVAEDVLQETWLTALRTPRSLRESTTGHR